MEKFINSELITINPCWLNFVINLIFFHPICKNQQRYICLEFIRNIMKTSLVTTLWPSFEMQTRILYVYNILRYVYF
jgi:hypothetical protein